MSDSPKNILDSPAISGHYLFPQPRMVRDVFSVEVSGATLSCYRQGAATDRPTLVHFHGNGEAVADYVPDIADHFSAVGVNCLFVEYREYGGSTGSARLVEMLPDGEAVVRAAGLAFDKVIAFGRSIGSLYAIELAHRHDNIAGLIIESGIADPSERFLTYADLQSAGFQPQDVELEVKKHFDHQAKLANYRNPVLLMHTENDGLVDISHAERLLDWAGSEDKQLVRFPNGDHNSIMGWNLDEYLGHMEVFVRQVS